MGAAATGHAGCYRRGSGAAPAGVSRKAQNRRLRELTKLSLAEMNDAFAPIFQILALKRHDQNAAMRAAAVAYRAIQHGHPG